MPCSLESIYPEVKIFKKSVEFTEEMVRRSIDDYYGIVFSIETYVVIRISTFVRHF